MQHRLLDEYVTKIAPPPPGGGGRGETHCDAVELAHHLSALADASVAKGATNEEAAREAIRQFGSAPTVRRDLMRAQLRGHFVKVTCANTSALLFTSVALAVPAMLATLSANTITPETIATAIMVAYPSTTHNTTVFYGALFPPFTVVTGVAIAFFRGRRVAFSVIPVAVIISLFLPFALLSLIKGFSIGWPFVTPETWAFPVFSFVESTTYSYIGILAYTLWRRRRLRPVGV